VTARHLFIYFRVRRESEARAVGAVRELQAAWCAVFPGLHCELLRRADDADGGRHVTLMEVYRCDSGVPPSWQDRIERDAAARLAPWLADGMRHVEVFSPCA
jgi:hypothetical protein